MIKNPFLSIAFSVKSLLKGNTLNCPRQHSWMCCLNLFYGTQGLSSAISFTVNVAHDVSQRLQGTATMSENHFPNTQWTAAKVVDGDINQTAAGKSCAITSFAYKSVWLQVQLGNRFNVAYIQIFFRNELSMILLY